MSVTPAKIKSVLLRLNTAWQASLGLLLFFLWIVTAVLQVPENLEHAKKVTMFVTALLSALNLLLYVYLYFSRWRQLKRNESRCLFSNFKDAGKFEDVFSGAFSFRAGEIQVNRPVPDMPYWRFAESEEDIKKLSEINRQAFRGTNWSGGSSEKYERNLAIWKANPYAFFVLKKFDDGILGDFFSGLKSDIVFFSCILPLTKEGHERYFVDRVSGDNQFRADWVAAPGEETHSVLMFTFARHPDLAKTFKANWRTKLIFLYLQCVAVHLQKILEVQCKDLRQATVYFQNSGAPFKRLAECAKMDKSSLRSRDDETVFVSTAKAVKGTFGDVLNPQVR